MARWGVVFFRGWYCRSLDRFSRPKRLLVQDQKKSYRWRRNRVIDNLSTTENSGIWWKKIPYWLCQHRRNTQNHPVFPSLRGTMCDQRQPYLRMRASDEVGVTHERGEQSSVSEIAILWENDRIGKILSIILWNTKIFVKKSSKTKFELIGFPSSTTRRYSEISTLLSFQNKTLFLAVELLSSGQKPKQVITISQQCSYSLSSL